MWYKDWNDMYICQDMREEPYTRDYQEEDGEEEYEEYD